MKAEFNKSWNKSVQPRKQVKFRANAPNHIKKKFMSSSLDKALREKYGRRNIEVRKGDTVKIMRGKFSGKQGKVGIVDVKNTRIQVEGVQRTKIGGEKMITWFHPSKVKIIILHDEDKKRLRTKGSLNVKVVEESKKKDSGEDVSLKKEEKAEKKVVEEKKVNNKTTKVKTETKKVTKEEKK